ncbi:MAG: hypothetical protein ACRC10_12465 [Thermoguttaceae bacterium]
MGEELTFWAIIVWAASTAVFHTLAGPDHYLPFIVLTKKCKWSLFRSMLWTFICGVGHVATALLLVVALYLFSSWFTETRFEFINEYRNSIAAWLLVALGSAYLIWGIRHIIRYHPHTHLHLHAENEVEHEHEHTHVHEHSHFHVQTTRDSLTPWILFIVLALGPCEIMFPILSAASLVGTHCVVLTAIVFCSLTILTMMSSVYLGLCGIKALNLQFLERYSHAIGGLTIMSCGLVVIVFGW